MGTGYAASKTLIFQFTVLALPKISFISSFLIKAFDDFLRNGITSSVYAGCFHKQTAGETDAEQIKFRGKLGQFQGQR